LSGSGRRVGLAVIPPRVAVRGRLLSRRNRV